MQQVFLAKGRVLLASLCFEKHTTSQYLGEWVDYPELPWLQPAFPAAGIRYELKKDEPLILEYRLWIHHGGRLKDDAYAAEWREFQATQLTHDKVELSSPNESLD